MPRRRPLSAVFPATLIASLIAVSGVGAQSAAPRYALVVGNSAYRGMTALANPANDAEDMAAALRGLGFTVDLVKNATKMAMEDALVALKKNLATDAGAEGVFYYAGHGVQSEGVNYLIPVDAQVPEESLLRYRAVDAGMALDLMKASGNAVNLVILDACRDNPFGWSRSATRGLTVVGKQPAGSIVVYATAAGATAADGQGRNGLFTASLLKHLSTPGLDVMEVFRRTGAEVQRLSGGAQTPAVYAQFFGSWTLARAAAAAPAAPAAAAPAVAAPAVSFGPLAAATGSLAVTLATGGRLSVGGASADIGAGTLPVNNLPVGAVTVTVAYPDGKTEQAAAYVEAGKTVAVAFDYVPPRPGAAAPAPAAAEPAAAAAPVAAAAPAPGRALRKEVLIPAGAFTMGSPANEVDRDDDEVQHKVTLSAFWMMATEVTQKDYAALAGANPSKVRGDGLPVEQVSWYEAVAYANRLSAKDGLKPAYTINGTTVSCDWTASGWRLPTEAEWEYACRAGTATPFSFGANLTPAQANYDGDYPYNGAAKGVSRQTTVPAGSLPANNWGLFEMHGNVWEWCWDWHAGYRAAAATNPTGPASGVARMIRGGGWGDYGEYLRSAGRNWYVPDGQRVDIGFRLVRSAAR
jgi:formylglycine-generating enzyme required for sulfatase activity